MSDQEKVTAAEVEMKKPLALKIAEAKSEVLAGNITHASPLTIDTAEKLQQLAGFWGLVSTPNGLATVLALIAGIGSAGALIAKGFSGTPQTDKEGYVLVKVVEMPRLHVDDGPTPLPVVTSKPFNILTFSDVVPPPGPWDALRKQGYRVDHHSTTSAEASLYAALIAKVGGPPCVMVTDKTHFIGGGPVADVSNIVTKYTGSKP